MARIRSIKPEFTQSETIGRLSRDARLLFVQIWTVADDDGRARASSRGLASALYPFDDDAPALIDGWLRELEVGGFIRRYVAEGSTYLEVNNWRKHQKIDRPSPSRLPGFNEGSLIFGEASTNARGPLAADLGPRTMDLGRDLGEETREEPRAPPAQDLACVKPKSKNQNRGTRWPADAVVPGDWLTAGAEVRARAGFPEIDLKGEAMKFANYWSAKTGNASTKLDWKKTWLNWALTSKGNSNGKPPSKNQPWSKLADALRGREQVHESDGDTIDGTGPRGGV